MTRLDADVIREALADWNRCVGALALELPPEVWEDMKAKAAAVILPLYDDIGRLATRLHTLEQALGAVEALLDGIVFPSPLIAAQVVKLRGIIDAARAVVLEGAAGHEQDSGAPARACDTEQGSQR